MSCGYHRTERDIPHCPLGGVQVHLLPMTPFVLLLYNIISGGILRTKNGQYQADICFMFFIYLYLYFYFYFFPDIWNVLCGSGLVCFRFQFLFSASLETF